MHHYLKKFISLAAIILSVYYRNSFKHFINRDFETKNIKNCTNREVGMKYILQWTSTYLEPYIFIEKGQKQFLDSKCPVNNCYITSRKENLKTKNLITDYDAILFHGPLLKVFIMPLERSPRQIYIFVSMESSHYYPVIDEEFDNFFNWTWTYKLDSDLYARYFNIRNKRGEIIGPKENMHWLKTEEMMPISDELKTELNQKNSTVAWVVSNCGTYSGREEYVSRLSDELRKYNITLHIYGKCGSNSNSLSKPVDMNLIKRYHFYLSFENSFSEDYVTEKLLHSLLNNAVPIVYGLANYTRFLPDGAYLNAFEMEAKDIAKIIFDAMSNKTIYYDFFRWKNYYSYHVEENFETNSYCRLCSKLNQKEIEVKTYKNFRHWWNT